MHSRGRDLVLTAGHSAVNWSGSASRRSGGNDDDGVSYSPSYDRHLMSRYAVAVAGRTSRRGPYP